MRHAGIALFIVGLVLGTLGWFAVLMELSTDPDNIGVAAFAAFLGTALSNLGFALLMFGHLEDRIYQSEAVILAELKGAPPVD